MLFPPKQHYIPGDGVCLCNAYTRKITQQKHGHMCSLACLSQLLWAKAFLAYLHLPIFICFFVCLFQQLVYSQMCFDIFFFLKELWDVKRAGLK